MEIYKLYVIIAIYFFSLSQTSTINWSTTFCSQVPVDGGSNKRSLPKELIELIEYSKKRSIGQSQTLECANVTVPMDYSQPNGTQIYVVAYRFLLNNNGTAPSSQVWWLVGGPGSYGHLVGNVYGAPLLGVYWNSDIYFMDYRGLGYSRPNIYCPLQLQQGMNQFSSPDYLSQCGTYLVNTFGIDLLKQITTTNIAYDIATIINGTTDRTPTQKIFFYAESYATYLANRFLILFPNILNGGVIFDGIVVGPLHWFNHYDYWSQYVFDQLLVKCMDDSYCSSQYNKDTDYFNHTLAALKNGTLCPNGLSILGGYPSLVFSIRYYLIIDPQLRELIMPLLYRLNRCDSQKDIPFFEVLQPIITSFINGISNYSYENVISAYNWVDCLSIVINEFVDTSVSTASLTSWYESMSLGIGNYSINLRATVDSWPISYNDTLSSSVDSSMVPKLLVSGELDCNTGIEVITNVAPLWKNVTANVIVPFGSHINVINKACPFSIASSFIEGTTINTTCVSGMATLYAISFQNCANFKKSILNLLDTKFDTNFDMWNGDLNSTNPSVPVGNPSIPVGNPSVPMGNPSIPVGNPSVPVGNPSIPVGNPTGDANIHVVYGLLYITLFLILGL